MRIAAIPISDRNMGSSRIRLFSLMETLPNGYSFCLVRNKADAALALTSCDAIYVQKAAWPPVIEFCKQAAQLKKHIIYDIDDEFGVWQGMAEDQMCALADLVTVDSNERAAHVKAFTSAPICVIPCMVDLPNAPERKLRSPRQRMRTVCTFGFSNSIRNVSRWLVAAKSIDLEPYVISVPSAAQILPGTNFKPFSVDTFVSDLLIADLVLLRHGADLAGTRKGNNRLIMAMSLGLPAITSRTPAYIDTLGDVGLTELACDDNEHDFKRIINELRSRGRRADIGKKFYDYAWDTYNPTKVCRTFLDALNTHLSPL